MKNIESGIIYIEKTDEKNCSESWYDKHGMIKKYPYHAVLKGIGGGYFENIEAVKKFYSRYHRINGIDKITGYGNWEVEIEN